MMVQTGFEGIACPEQGDDFVATPPDLTRRLFHFCPLPPGPLLDPFAGGGAILDVAVEVGKRPRDLFAVEIRLEEKEELYRRLPDDQCWFDSWYKVRDACHWCHPQDDNRIWCGWPASIVITNPPFSQLPDYAEACFPDGASPRNGYHGMQYVALFMPIDELAGKQKTAKFLKRVGMPTDLVVVPYRVWGGVRGVAWFVWQIHLMAERKGSTVIHG